MTEEPKEVSALSEEEKKLILMMRTLDIKPHLGGPAEMVKVAKVLSDEAEEDKEPIIETKKPSTHHYPKFSIFYGEDGKGEVSWETFKYEVMSVMMDSTYTQEQIMFGIRRSLKGKASDKIRRLGVGAAPDYVLRKLDSDYGTVENKETALKKFYTYEQKLTESVESFASRLEELFYKAVELKAFRITDTEGLKQALHNGLRKDLKQMSVYQCDKIKDYDEFKRELRKMESEMADKPEVEEKKPCKPAVSAEKKDSELAQILRQLNDRIGRLEQEQQHKRDDYNPGYWYSGRGHKGNGYSQDYGYTSRGQGRGRWRGNARGRGNPRGRGSYQPERSIAGETFSPTCYLCNRKGHIQMNCPTILAQLVCLHCKQKGHLKKDCPNL